MWDLAVLCPAFLKSIIFLKLTGGNSASSLVDIKYEKLGKPRTHKLHRPFFHNSLAIKSNSSLSDCSFLIARRIQSANQRALGYVYTRYFGQYNVSLIIKCFQFITRLHKLKSFCLQSIVKVQLLFAMAHQNKYPPPPKGCTIFVH